MAFVVQKTIIAATCCRRPGFDVESGVAFLSECGSNSSLVRSPLECRSATYIAYFVRETSAGRGRGASARFGVHRVGADRVCGASYSCVVFVTPSPLLPWVQRECSWRGTSSALTVFVAAACHAIVGCGVAVRWSPAVSSLPVPMRY